mmetsp:Transcript_1286/g.2447  ORF Transcript_1286/g.2447 Transcript_1286/m.2447 type:complete len:227 (+) Transcript_1286:2550-3230(+)
MQNLFCKAACFSMRWFFFTVTSFSFFAKDWHILKLNTRARTDLHTTSTADHLIVKVWSALSHRSQESVFGVRTKCAVFFDLVSFSVVRTMTFVWLRLPCRATVTTLELSISPFACLLTESSKKNMLDPNLPVSEGNIRKNLIFQNPRDVFFSNQPSYARMAAILGATTRLWEWYTWNEYDAKSSSQTSRDFVTLPFRLTRGCFVLSRKNKKPLENLWPSTTLEKML